MFTALLNPNDNSLTVINKDHSDYPFYRQGKEVLFEAGKKAMEEKIEEWQDENFIPDELRIVQHVK